jgi:hypothetical protein
MADIVIRTNDMIQITVPPPAMVPMLMSPVPLIGTGTTVLVGNQPVCLQGDELPPSLRAPMPYTAPPFVTPGMGTLTLIVTPSNLATKTLNGKPLLIKGGSFQAIFSVTVPAMQPTPGGPVPDPLMVKNGTAVFIPSLMTVQAG